MKKYKVTRFLGLILVAILMFNLGGGSVLKAANSEVLTVYGLTSEYNENPEVIDAKIPYLGWKLSSQSRGVMQTKYRIMAAYSLEALNEGRYDAWDSEEITSDVSTQVEYKGEIKAGMDYHWKVQVWDNNGNNAISEPAKFGVGLLEESDWSGAQWISNIKTRNAAAEYTLNMKFNMQSNSNGDSTAASIIFGAQDSNNYYMYQITSFENDGKLMLKPHEKKNGSWIAYTPVQISSDVIPDNKQYDSWNILRIEYKNGNIITYINNKLVDNRDMPNEFGSGYLGFRACLDNNLRECALYDDISITEGDNVIYSEDFQSGVFDSYETIAGTGTAVIENGALKINPDSVEYIMLQKINANKYTIESDFSVENMGGGFVFAYQDSNNFKMWQVNIEQNGIVRLRPHVWAGAISSEDVDISSAIPWEERNGTHHIKIEVDGDKITTYINGTEVHSGTYSSLPIGKIGFRAAGSESIYADNYSVKDQMGQETYANDFSLENDFAGGEIIDGKLRVAGSENPILQRDARYTFTYDFQMVQTAMGVTFGAEDKQNFYMWQVKEGINENEGKVFLRPHIWKNGEPASLGDIDITSVIPWEERYDTHSMKIDVNNGTIITYIDDQQVDERSGMPFTKLGLVGIRVDYEVQTNKSEIAFYDNFKVVDEASNVIFEEDFSSTDYKFGAGTIENGRLYVEYIRNEIYWQSETSASLPYLRKDFEIQNKEISRAKIFSSALGVYEMYLNGERVGEDYLAPGWTDYDKRVEYQGYNVTDMLKSGEANVFGVRLAPGWYNGRLGLLLSDAKAHYGEELAFISKMVIEYTDGSSDVIISDNTWTYTTSTPLLASDLLDGESHDARLQIGGSPTAWATTAVDASNWNLANIKYTNRNLVAMTAPGVQIVDELPAKEMWKLDNGNIVVDFGQNFAGVIKMNVKGARGDKLTFIYGETLNADGKSVHTKNLRTAKATDTYIVGSDEPETFMPSFTFHGFRYAEIKGISDFKLEDITGIVFMSNLPITSTYESSSELVNQLYKNIMWGQKGNYLSIPTDCPQRDERLGWTGDAEVFVRTGSYNMDSMSFMSKFLTDMRDGQRSDGAYSNVAPIKYLNEYGSQGWGDAGVIIPWTLYHQYGDTRVIEENFEAMENFIKYYVNASNNLLFSTAQHGDWLNVDAETDKGLVATAFFAYSTQLLGEMADIMVEKTGEQKYVDSAKYHKALWADIQEAYSKKFIRNDGTCGNYTQGSYVLSLAFNLVPEGLEQTVADKLAEQIEKDGGNLTTGFLTVGRLGGVLTDYGYNDVTYKLLTNTSYPSWGYSIERGATTIWERWNSCKDDGTIDDSLNVMNSLNHYSLGSIGEWMFTDSLGIDWGEEGFKDFVLKPNPTNAPAINMTYAKGSYESINGTIKSEWSYDENGNLVYKAAVPANTTATLYLPVDGSKKIYESGILADDAEGVTFVEEKDGRMVYKLVSGEYTFTQENVAKNEPEDPTNPVTGIRSVDIIFILIATAAVTVFVYIKRRRRYQIQ